MKVWDITLPLHPNHQPWPGDIPFSHTLSNSTARGDECNVSELHLSSHFGTHLDAPFHFEPDGMTLEQLPLETLMGPVLVHEVSSFPLIQPNDLPDLFNTTRIIFKTCNTNYISDETFHTDFVALSNEAAMALVEAGIILVGIDYFSIEAYKNPGHPVHHTLCGNGVIIVEGLDLRQVDPGEYDLIVFPLKIKGGDGSPCRAVLRRP